MLDLKHIRTLAHAGTAGQPVGLYGRQGRDRQYSCMVGRLLLFRSSQLISRRFWLWSCLCLVAITLPRPALAWWMYTPGDTVDDVGFKPPQPIPFSHKLHAGDRKIPCQYCHAAARQSNSGGIPPLNTCMGCHKMARTGRDAVKQIADNFQKNKPVEWVKVHDLPQFAHFAHKVHVKSGLACQECHGPVETMDVVEQVAPLQMGWCIGCHKEKNVSTDCITCHY